MNVNAPLNDAAYEGGTHRGAWSEKTETVCHVRAELNH